MPFDPLLSVIVTARNSAPTIRSCLESLERNLRPLPMGWVEVIAVDGHSNDGTLEIVNSFRFPKTVVFSEIGVARAYNNGVREATGRWIAFLNSDDEYADGFLATVCGRLREVERCPRSRPVVLHTAVQFINVKGELLYVRYPAPYIGFFQKHHSIILHPNACYPAELMKRQAFVVLPGNRPSDQQQVYRLMQHARAERVPEALYRYRIWSNSGTVQLARHGEPKPPPISRALGLLGRVYVQLFETRLLPRLVRRLITGDTDWRLARKASTQTLRRAGDPG